MPTLPPLKYPLKTKNSAKLSYLKLATSELTSEPALTLTPAPALTPTSNLVNKKIADLRMVLLDYFIIKMIIFSKHSMYGKEILQKLKALGLSSKEGTIYPLLSKLRRENLILHSYEESDVGPPRKYYYITDQGRHYFTEIQRLLQGL